MMIFWHLLVVKRWSKPQISWIDFLIITLVTGMDIDRLAAEAGVETDPDLMYVYQRISNILSKNLT